MKLTNIYTKGHIVYCFERVNRKLKLHKDEDFYPYFYVFDKTKSSSYISLFRENVRKIVVQDPKQVREEREKYEKIYEADVFYKNRYLIDKVDKIEKTDLRIWFLDIEIASEKWNDPFNPDDHINLIGLYDNYTDKYYFFVYFDFIEDDILDSKNMYVYLFDDYKKMYRSFVKFLKQNIPDIVYAWNGNNYDYPYIFNELGSIIQKASVLNDVIIHRDYYALPEVSFLDLLEMYKRITIADGKKESYSLDYIGNVELGYGKIKGKELFTVKSVDDIQQLILYNKRDIDIMIGVEKKWDITNYFDNIRIITKSTWDQLCKNSRIIDNYLLQKAKDFGIVLPTRRYDEKLSTFKGAYIAEPKKGVYDNVVVLDMTSLYPSIMYSMNISPETIIDKCNDCIKVGEFYYKKDSGFIKRVIKDLFMVRQEIIDKMNNSVYGSIEYITYDRQQAALKGLINSLFGYFGFVGSRFFDQRLASSVTYTARTIIKKVWSFLEDKGYNVLYADTDSVFVEVNKQDNLKNLLDIGFWLKDEINNMIDDFVRKEFNTDDHILEIKFEKVYSRIILLAKKRYVGRLIWKKGKEVYDFDYVGVEIRRSDNPKFIKDIQHKVFEMILDGNSFDDIRRFIYDVIKNIDKVDLDDLGIPIGINKPISEYKGNIMHIRAVKYSNKYLNKNFHVGDRVRYIFVKRTPKGLPPTDVVAFDDPNMLKGFEIDYDRLIERIKKKLDSIFEIFSIDMNIKHNIKSNKLF